MERSAVLFGQNTVFSWLDNSLLDPIRSGQEFIIFNERIGGSEFREYLASIERSMREHEAGIRIDTTLPGTGSSADNPLLNRSGVNRR